MAKNSDPKINGNFKGKDILSLDQFSSKDIEILFRHTKAMRRIAEKCKPSRIIAGHVVGLIFYEPSSRTFGSFSSAVKRIGGQTVEYQNPKENSSVAKGETLSDTMQTIQSYVDAIVIRHPQTGAAKEAAEAASIPVINAGDGIGEHPTQALLDLYTIKEQVGRLNNLTVLFGGDMLNGRTVHSLIRGLSLFKGNTAVLLSPRQLKLDRAHYDDFKKRGIRIIEIEQEKDIPKKADLWYWTRVQKERFQNIKYYEKVKNTFVVTPEFLKKYASKKMILMHPLPRVGEITTDVDNDPRAMYLRVQMRNGMYVRMALLALILGKV